MADLDAAFARRKGKPMPVRAVEPLKLQEPGERPSWSDLEKLVAELVIRVTTMESDIKSLRQKSTAADVDVSVPKRSHVDGENVDKRRQRQREYMRQKRAKTA
jgi:hypothetical protein